MYNTKNNSTEPTIGWLYLWNIGHNRWAFGDDNQALLENDSHFLPMYAYPSCTETTDAEMGGDGTCDDDTCWGWGDNNVCNHAKGKGAAEALMADGYGEKYFAYFNEPYGSEQADVTPDGAIAKWTHFMELVDDYAAINNIPRQDIKIVGPSIAHKEGAMLWAEGQYDVIVYES